MGRRSGRSYATPVVARAVPGGFAVPLPYGTGVDWVRNLRASGHGWLQTGGVRCPVSDPRIVPTDELAADLDPLWRRIARLYAIRAWLVLTAGPPAPDPRADGAARQPAGSAVGAGTR